MRNMQLAGKESDLVNGSRGVVVGWTSREEKLEKITWKLSLFRTPKFKTNPVEDRLLHIAGKLSQSTIEFIPIVAFRNGRVIDCDPEMFDYQVLKVGSCTRVQVSLIYFFQISFKVMNFVVHGCILVHSVHVSFCITFLSV